MHDTLPGRAVELAHLTDLIRASLALADSAIHPINEQLAGLAELGIDNLEIEGPAVFSRVAGSSPAFDDDRIVYAAALLMPGGPVDGSAGCCRCAWCLHRCTAPEPREPDAACFPRS